MANGQGSLQRLGPDRWRLRVYAGLDLVTGKQIERSRILRTTSIREATRALARFAIEVEEKPALDGRMSLNDLIERWLPLHPVGTTTRRTYINYWKNRIQPGIGRRPIREVTPYVLDTYYDRLMAEGMSPGAVKQINAILSGAFRQAIKWNVIDRNPTRDATKPRNPETEIKAPSVDQVQKLILQAGCEDPELELAIMLKVGSGLRRGELCGLMNDAILTTEDGVFLSVHRSLVRLQAGEVPGLDYVHVGGKKWLKDPKNHQRREMRLPPTVAMMVLEHMAKKGEFAHDPYFLFSTDAMGKNPWAPDTLTHRAKRLSRSVGFEGVRLHDLRHFNATELASSGAPMKVIGERLGHSQQQTTSRYVHVRTEDDKQAADRIDKLFSSGKM